MESTAISLRVTVPVTVEEADEAVRAALAEQGFGVLSRIDIDAALREKIGSDVGEFRILGACNPGLADRAIALDPAVGVLLPCNVVLRRAPDASLTTVEAMDPTGVFGAVDHPDLKALALQARAGLKAALRALEASAGPTPPAE